MQLAWAALTDSCVNESLLCDDSQKHALRSTLHKNVSSIIGMAFLKLMLLPVYAGSSPAEQHSAYTGVGWLTGASQHQDSTSTSSRLPPIDTVMGSSLPGFGHHSGQQGTGSGGNPLHQPLDSPDLSTLKEHGFKTVPYSLWKKACLAERTSMGDYLCQSESLILVFTNALKKLALS